MSARSPGQLTDAERRSVGLPISDFLYTLDQIAFLLNVGISSLERHIRFIEVTGGRRPAGTSTQSDKRMRAVRLRPSELHDHDEWRVPESEVIRYFRSMGLMVYERKYRV